MVISLASASSASEAPLLEDAVDGAVDYRGRRAYRSTTGGWRSACFVIGVEIAERFAYYGIGVNLISYLTGPLRQPTATAAENVNAWSGTALMLPLLGAFVADSCLGRYRTIVISSILYVLGLGLLTLSAVLPSLGPSDCKNMDNFSSCPPPSQLQVVFFFLSLYLVALAQGGHKPCVQAFGADQFDGRDPKECKSKSSFFNWWYFGLCGGTALTVLISTYIQDNLNWSLGFGIPCVTMASALVVLLLGTKTYRYTINNGDKSPFERIGQVFIVAAKNWRAAPSYVAVEEVGDAPPQTNSHQFTFLDKALIPMSNNLNGSKEDMVACSVSEVEEAKAVLRLVPIWITCLAYAVVFAQSPTFFTKQGSTMDRSLGSGFQIPPASFQSFIGLSVILFIPIYDRVLVPIARTLTGKPSGISMLQRIGTGMCLSVLAMVIAAIVEKKRLETALNFGLIDQPQATVPMSVWWLVPQYILFGLSDVFTMVGLQEFFYDQMPEGLRSMGLSLYLSIFGIGSFLSSFLISAIEKATGGDGHDSWFSDNLNRAHLDYFYWLLAGLSILELAAFLFFARSYIYNKASTM